MTFGLGIAVVVLMFLIGVILFRKRLFAYFVQVITRRKHVKEVPGPEAIPLRPLPAIPTPSAPEPVEESIIQNIGHYHQRMIPYYSSSTVPVDPPSSVNTMSSNNASTQMENNTLYEPVDSRPQGTLSLSIASRIRSPYENSTYKRARAE